MYREEDGGRLLPPSQASVLKAKEVLDTYLGPGEVELAQALFKDRSRGIRWERVKHLLLDDLLIDAYTLLHGNPLRRKADVFKRNQEASFEEITCDLPSVRARQAENLAMLKMAFKILTILRLAVRQRIAEVPTLTDGDLELLQEAMGEAQVADDDSDPIVEVKAIVHQGEIEAYRQERCASGRHTRITIVKKLTEDGMETIRRCRDCGVLLNDDQTSSPKSSEECQHPRAIWAAGMVGKKAVCAVCGAEVPADEYDWREAGLEEPGDDPVQDEVIELCTGS